MIEKMLEKFEELKVNDVCMGILCSECEKKYGENCDKAQQALTIDQCKKIVQEVAKEYAERTCHNCKYESTPGDFEPCCVCSKAYSDDCFEPKSASYQKGE